MNSTPDLIRELKPVIVSASRATDIPAFYSDWFFNRLKEGYLIKLNPYNQKPYRISFENTKFIVFWTKNPKPVLKHISYLDGQGIDYYFQFTLNDYSREEYEKNVPPLSERIATFKELSSLIGKEKVIWRFDPLLLSDKITLDTLAERIEYIGGEIADYTKRLVFSFFDMYKSVGQNLKRLGHPDIREFTKAEMDEFTSRLSVLNNYWNLSLYTCSEETDLSKYGVMKGSCIDSKLIRKICADNEEMSEYLLKNSSKDRNQRPLCGCIPSTDIGQYNTCIHQCLYCYATRNTNAAIRFYRHSLKNPESDSLLLKKE